MAAPKDYSSFAELERDLVRPEMRIGWSVDEIESTGETLEFDMDHLRSRDVGSGTRRRRRRVS